MRLVIGHGGDMGEPSGGTERVSAIASGLANRGIDVTLVIPRTDGRLPERLQDVEVIQITPPVAGALARAASVARRANRVADVRDAVLQLEHSTLAGVATLFGIEGYILDMHDLGYGRYEHLDTPMAPLLERTVKWLEGRGIRRASTVVTVSNVMADMVEAEWGISSEGMTTVPNGYFPETVEAVDDADADPGRVTFLGTLHPKVDVDTLAAIARHDAVRELVVIGDGAQRDLLDRAAADIPALEATGRLPDPEAFELVNRSAAVVNPQATSPIQESSSPVKLYYYAALGKPMVVTPGPEVVDKLVRHEAAITAVSRRNFVERTVAVLRNHMLAADLSRNTREFSSGVTWSARVDAFEEIVGGLEGELRE